MYYYITALLLQVAASLAAVVCTKLPVVILPVLVFWHAYTI